MSKTNFFILLLCLFLLILKIISAYLTNFDLFGDEAQYWLWSKNLDFGYYSKPPLLPWLIAFVCLVFGNSFFVIKMIPIFMYCITSYVVFILSKKLLNNIELAFLIAVTFFLMPAVSVSSFLISTDILLVLFWSLSMMQVLVIKEKPSDLNFLLLGIFVGLAFLAKYAAIYFVFCLIILLFFEKEMRSIFLKKGVSFFYFVMAACFVVAPNIIWNINNDWISFGHLADNAALTKINLNFLGAVNFVVSQVIMVGPIVFLFFVFLSRRIKLNFISRFLLTFSLPVFFIILLESILVRANANWAAVSLVSFLILFVHLVFRFNKKIIYLNNIANFFLGSIFFILIVTNSSYEPFKRISGISSFAKSIEKYSGDGVGVLVVSDRMLFSNLSYIFRNNQIEIYVPFTPGSKIGHHFQISNALPASFDKKFIFVGYADQLDYLENKNVINLLDTTIVRFSNEPIKIYEIVF